MLTLHGSFDADAVRQAIADSVQRHEALRTTFARQPGLRHPLQVVHDTLPAGFTALAAGDAPAARRAAMQAPLDHAQGPLLDVQLASDGDHHELTLTVSALCADPASLALLAGEIATALTGEGERVEDPLQYADFAAWQSELLGSQDDEAKTARTRLSELADSPYPELPFAGRETAGADSFALELPAELQTAVRAAAQRYGVSASSVVQAAWQSALARLSGASEVAVAYMSGDRRHDDLDGAIGAFSRPVPVGAATGAQVSFAELVHAIDRARDEALVLQDYTPAGNGAPVPAAFIAVSAPDSLREVSVTGGAALALTCLQSDERLALTVAYDSGVHSEAAAQRVAAALSTLLACAAADPGAALGALPVLSEAERTQLITGFAGPAREIAPVSLPELIAARSARAADAPAVIDATGEMTHAELQDRSAQVARRLLAAGVAPGDRVALCMHRGADLVAALLGILRAGAAYVPLHYEHPQARLAAQLQTVQAAALVTEEALLGVLPEFTGPVLCLDRDRAALAAESTDAPEVAIGADALAYVIFTSGSTGAPKGVAVTQANVVNYATALLEVLQAGDDALRFAMVTSIATDLGNTSLFGALCSGGTLVIPSAEAAGDPGPLAELLHRARVDVLKITPSHLGALLAAGDARILPARTLVLGGERAPWDLIDTVRGLRSPAILNHYGPTETTIGSCTYPVGADRGAYDPASVPIGAPLANTACYVLDELGAPAPLGVPGRLHIAGAGVAQGYVGQPELTAERFAADPFVAGQRMYDTGDLARWLPDGNLEFLGRADDQVKIRGYRVEPGEIETVLRAHPAVSEAFVISHGSGSEMRLAAYAGASGSPSVDELRDHLAARLPDYMVPAALAVLERLPRTPSGKIDRLALPDPDTLAVSEEEYVAPRSPMEEAVSAIWASVLGVPRVGIEDDFFSLGGHSLLATQVVAQVRSDFAVDLPLHSLFTYPTVAELTGEIVSMMGAADDDETARLMAELDGMSDEEAERLLRGDHPAPS